MQFFFLLGNAISPVNRIIIVVIGSNATIMRWVVMCKCRSGAWLQSKTEEKHPFSEASGEGTVASDEKIPHNSTIPSVASLVGMTEATF